MKPILEFLCQRIQQNRPFPEGSDVESIRYAEEGYIDSIEIARFIIDVEKEFDLYFTDEELESDAFQSVGSLASLIQEKQTAADQ